MRSLRSRTLAVVAVLLAWSVAALLPLLHVHRAPVDAAPTVLVHLPGDGHVHVAVRDYGHADTWDDAASDSPAHATYPFDQQYPGRHDCPACLAATIFAGTLLPPIGAIWTHPDPTPVRLLIPARAAKVRASPPSSFHARAPPSV